MSTMERYERRRGERGLKLSWMLNKPRLNFTEDERVILSPTSGYTAKRQTMGEYASARLMAERATAEEVLQQQDSGGAFSWWVGLNQKERAAVIEAARSKKR